MGFFGKLFEKKVCDVCEGEIGLLGNRKLEDGNLCKECAGKLSPWFDDRRNSTVEQIKAQLAYREANKEKVAAFRVSRSFGDRNKVLVDEEAAAFMITSETSPQRMAEVNPDVVPFADITGCELDIDDSYEELKREGKDGEEISYVPPRYRYDYDFYVKIYVNNPYFDDMRVKLNSSTVSIEYQNVSRGLSSGLSGKFIPDRDAEYRKYKQMGEELKNCLLQVEEKQEKEVPVAAATVPQQPVICPCCGAETMADSKGCCEYCGSALKA